MKKKIAASLAANIVILAGAAWADYTLVLKNGRRISVESYREDAGTIKFRGLGGEIGIPKDQIELIGDAGEGGTTGLSLGTRTAPTASSKTEPTLNPNLGPKPVEQKEPAQQKAENPRVKEEKEYREKLKALTERLKALREEYARETRGNSGPEPYLFTTEEAFRGHQQDLLSRLKDAQQNSGPAPDGGPVNLVTSASQGAPPEIRQVFPPPRSERIGPPPIESYTPREKLLSNLRREILETEKQRQDLIDQMKAKEFDTGSLFLD